MSDVKAPLSLRAARRSLRNLPGVELLGDWTAVGSLWALPCRLNISVGQGSVVPASTDWFVVSGGDYPRDTLKIYPAKKNGITATFPHQAYNGEGAADEPYRGGALCLNVPGHLLGRGAAYPEPFASSGTDSRLAWHVVRALGWLEAAAAGRLLSPGDPFELPEYPAADVGLLTLAFLENSESFNRWLSITANSGIVELSSWPAQPLVVIVKQFLDASGRTLLANVWGDAVVGATNVERAAWLRLPAPPILQPWQAPRTWGELRRFCREHQFRLDEVLRQLFARLRDGKAHLLLVGFPIPRVMAGNAEHMYWLAIRLPVLSRGKVFFNGFRPGARMAHWLVDRRDAVADSQPISWQNSENWSPEELATRGRLPDALSARKVLLIGGGTIGSAIGELLIRGGVRRLTIMDDDTLKAGNLCRHTLLLQDVLKNKAEQLGERLRSASPHVEVVAIKEPFPPTTAETLEKVAACDLVLDCTAEDEAIRKLAGFAWAGPRFFASVWLGLRAQRVFCFSASGNGFPVRNFDNLVQPWLRQESGESGAGDLPREGIGCWHPVFPAGADDVWLLASAIVKHLSGALSQPDAGPTLAVFEQTADEAGFAGLRRVAAEVAHA